MNRPVSISVSIGGAVHIIGVGIYRSAILAIGVDVFAERLADLFVHHAAREVLVP